MKNLLFVRITDEVLTNSVNGLFNFVSHFKINIEPKDIRKV